MAQYIGQWANVDDIEIAELTMEQLGQYRWKMYFHGRL